LIHLKIRRARPRCVVHGVNTGDAIARDELAVAIAVESEHIRILNFSGLDGPDDSHAIQDNIYIRNIRNIPRYFTDATTFSVLPLNQSYRPLLQTTFAVDYWLAGGYKPIVFQVDTFIWYGLLLGAIGWLFLTVAGDPWVAAIATSIYALHPVCAETVNYIVQRGDLLSTLGVVTAEEYHSAR